MKNVFNQISRHQVLDVAKSLGQVSLVAVTTSVANRVLKTSVESALNGMNNIRTTIKNS